MGERDSQRESSQLQAPPSSADRPLHNHASPRRAALSLPFFLPLLLFLLAITTPPAESVGLGVNKGSIAYSEVLQSGYAQEEVLVTTDSVEEVVGTYELVGEVAPWVRIEPPTQNFTFSKSKPHRMTIIVEPPGDARLGTYSGGLRILTGELARTSGGKIGTTTRAAFLIKIGVGVTGTERVSCVMGGAQVRNTEVGDSYDFVVSVRNTGNVRIKPSFTIIVYDQYQTRILQNVTVSAEEEVLPTTTREFLFRVAHDLPPGQYWARVTAEPCGSGSFLTFDVLERGEIADKGELLRIEVRPWAETGEIIPITAFFKNVGPRVVRAKLTGTITKQGSGRIYKVIDTDAYDVRPGETAEIKTFFNPVEPGQYIIAGRVLYNNKLSFQKSAILNVNGPFLEAVQGWFWPALLLLLIVILLLLVLIAKKRRRGPVSHRILR